MEYIKKERLIQEVKEIIDIDMALLEHDNDIISYINNNIKDEISLIDCDLKVITVNDNEYSLFNHYITEIKCFSEFCGFKARKVKNKSSKII